MRSIVKNIPPITPQTTLKNAHLWLNIVRFHESGTVIQLQDDCEYRVADVIENRKLLKSKLGPNFQKYLLCYVRIDEKNLMETVRSTLVKLTFEKKLDTLKRLRRISSIDLLNTLASHGYSVGIFISHVNSLIDKSDFQPFFDLDQLILISKNLSVILFAVQNITYSKYAKFVDKCTSLFDHVIKYPLYSKKNAEQFARHYQAYWQMKLDENKVQSILDECGGYLWLIHQSLRTLRDNPEFTLVQVFSDELIQKKLEAIWSKITPEEKQILKKIAYKTISEKDTLCEEFNYLVAINLIKVKQKEFILGVPLFLHLIEKEGKIKELYLKNQRILAKDKDISIHFTPKEFKFLRLLLSQKNKLITRESVAQILWLDRWEEEYSDWAIDRLTHRLRKKLKTLGIDQKLLQTMKKKGFIWE